MIDDYFSILKVSSDNMLSGVVRICLNPDSSVYEGHFPGEPVSPGVCNLEMIRRCAAAVHHQPLRILRIKQCRMTSVMTPDATPQADVNITLQETVPGVYRITAAIENGSVSYLTMKAEVADE